MSLPALRATPAAPTASIRCGAWAGPAAGSPRQPVAPRPGRPWASLLALLVVLLAGGTTPAPGAAGGGDARTLGEKSARSRRLQDQLSDLRVNLDFLDLRLRNAATRIRSLERKVAGRQEEVARQRQELDGLEAQEAATASEAGRLEEETAGLELRKAAIEQRFLAWLVRLHKVRQGTLVSNLFSAADLNSFLSRYQLIRHLLRHDRQLLTELARLERDLVARRAELATQRARLEQLSSLGGQARQKLGRELNGLIALLDTLVAERKLVARQQQGLQQDIGRLERQLAGLETARKSEPPGSLEAALDAHRPTPAVPSGPDGQPSPGSTSVAPPTVSPDPPAGDDDPESRRGTFRWPLARVSRLGFNDQNADTSGVGTVLSLPVDGEGQILAAARGKVLFKGPMGRLGNLIVLGHKHGYTTVYARLDEIWVGLGQIVEPGEAIGRVTPITDARLSFEIRQAGKPQPALPLLPRL